MKNKICQIFFILRNFLALIGFVAILATCFSAYYIARSYGLPPRLFAIKVLTKIGLEQSIVAGFVRPKPIRPDDIMLPAIDAADWRGCGARSERQMAPVFYDDTGRPVPKAWVTRGLVAHASKRPSRQIDVSDVQSFLNAIRQANPGDEILLASGVYLINSRTISVARGGTVEKPIVVKAKRLGDVIIELDSLDGFFINAPYWTFENLVIKGVSKNHNYGEHAFHIIAHGIGFVLRNSRLHEFNAMIKANGDRANDGEKNFPDKALIENNHFYNSEIRRTSKPVTFIDVVGANDWIVRGNLLADFVKGEGNRTSYGVYLKGNSSNGVIENNVVIGEYRTSGGVRIGISLGGGGTGAKYSRNGNDKYEHTGGMVRNNIMMYCSDVGLYVNKSRDSKIYNNTFYRTMGLDVRFPESTAVIRNNLLSSRIKERDGGVVVEDHNLIVDIDDFKDWFTSPDYGDFSLVNGEAFVDKGVNTPNSFFDFYDHRRDFHPDIGAVEYVSGQIFVPSILGK